MDAAVQHALEHGRVIDITTSGRKSGQPRRIEIWFHNLGGQIYITGLPGRRDWYANLRTNPHFIFHLKEGVQADLPAHATLIEDEATRRAVLAQIVQRVGRSNDLETWVAHSPLIAVTFEEPAGNKESGP